MHITENNLELHVFCKTFERGFLIFFLLSNVFPNMLSEGTLCVICQGFQAKAYF